jgi:S1-C subfamily serine protease
VAAPNRRRSLGLITTGALVVGVTAASVGVGHVLWPSKTATPSAAAAAQPGSGSTGSGSSGTTDPYSNPYSGSTGSGSNGTTDPYSGSNGGYSGGGSSGTGSSSSGTSSSGTSSASGSPSDVSSIATKVDPGLVDINVTFDYQQADGAGTGIVLTSNGEILTNNHVIEGATSISVTDIGNGKTYSAAVVGYDPTDDVAVIQLANASGLKTASIGNSNKLSDGEGVVAIGNAGGVGGTPSAAGGSITALNQSITASDELSGNTESLTGLIQTNADVQSGDSGGSLVNSDGQVVGMDTAAAQAYSLSSQTDQGYAIPIAKALGVASEIESGNSSTTVHVGATAFLGVLIDASSSSSTGSSGSSGSSGTYDPYGQQSGGTDVSGAEISSVVSGGAAANAGLTEGDVITSFGGQTVSSAAELSTVVQQYKPGNSVQIGWTDTSGQTHTATVTLGSGPAQ